MDDAHLGDATRRPTNMTAPRRWSFTLRTLFIALTLFGLGLGSLVWIGQTVLSRKRVRNWVAEHHGFFNPYGSIWSHEQRKKDAEIPWLRRALGDRAAVAIFLPPCTVTLDEIHAVEAVFPEATVAIGVPEGPDPVPPLRKDGVALYNWPPP